MPKRAIAVLDEQDMKTMTLASEEAMEKRRALASLIRARMTKPATAAEQRLWQELKAEMEKSLDLILRGTSFRGRDWRFFGSSWLGRAFELAPDFVLDGSP